MHRQLRLETVDRKWRMLRHVYRSNGAAAAIWELLCRLLKPVGIAYTRLVWQSYRWRGRSCFRVMGHHLTVLPGDKGVSIELAVHGMHEPRVTRLFSSCLRPGMVAVDVGANIGYYALLEARLVGKHGRVIAIEPVPENARVFLQNVVANGYSNITFRQTAISDRVGRLPLRLSPKSNWHSLSDVPWPTRELFVDVCTLDRLLHRETLPSVDLVRMDLEGHELAVINGMRETIEKYHPRLLIELHPHIVGSEATVQYLRQLETLGYSPEWMVDQERDAPWRWLLLKPEKPSMNELISDWRISLHPRAVTVLFAAKSRSITGSDETAELVENTLN